MAPCDDLWRWIRQLLGGQWNGAARATEVVSTTQLRISLLPTDLQAAGTGQVSVFAPEPGGGTSASLTVTIDPPASLTLSAPAVAPGGAATVTLVDGYGGSKDWIALAATGSANTSYLQWTYVGAGVTTRTWTVTAPSTAGTYEFRLFLNDGYTRVATSPVLTVDPSLNPAPIAGALSPSQAVVGASAFSLTVTGSKFVSSSIVRWNGANRPTTFVSATQLQASIGSGGHHGSGDGTSHCLHARSRGWHFRTAHVYSQLSAHVDTKHHDGGDRRHCHGHTRQWLWR